MTIKETKEFILEKISFTYMISRKMSKLPNIPVAYILYDPAIRDCFIKTCGANLQNYIIDWGMYCEFIMLVDEAFDRLKEEVKI